MILDSKSIKTKAERFRATLSEQQALVAEGRARGQSFDEMETDFDIRRLEVGF